MTAILNVRNKAPGVYIQEITLPGPLPAVTTSIAAFVGPAKMGPLNKPTHLTNINQFWSIFGDYIEDPYRVYAAHAMNGFFAEGGAECYFVRVGTGVQATLNLKDSSNNDRTVLVATALKEGEAGNQITVQVARVNFATTKAAKASTTGTLTTPPANKLVAITDNAGDANLFKPGDVVLLEKGAVNERATISSIESDTATPKATFHFVSALGADYGGGTIRIADFVPGQVRIRVEQPDKFETGTYVTITQGSTSEPGVVKLVDSRNNFLTLTSPLINTYSRAAASADVNIATQEFSLTIAATGKTTEHFDNLSLDSRHSRYFANLVTSALVSVDFHDPPTTTPPTGNLPVALAATNLGTAGQGTAGVDEDITKLTTAIYKAGIDTLRKLSVNLLCVPDAVGWPKRFHEADTQDIQAYMIAHCEKMQDRFAILDSREMTPDQITFNAVVNQRQNLNSDNGYGALYFPWIMISNPLGKGNIPVPPSGHTAGVYANNDNTFGVYKAPANEQITAALAVEVLVTDDEQGPLNEIGINVIRTFPFQGIKIWGARTIAPPDVTAWRFVNVRRLLIFIEKTIQEGTRFAVFEPNNLGLWQQIKRLVTDFLMDQWIAGALFGATPDLAFRVRVDETLNPPEIRALGQLIVEVTVVATTPAEFIVFQVVQDITGASLRETKK